MCRIFRTLWSHMAGTFFYIHFLTAFSANTVMTGYPPLPVSGEVQTPVRLACAPADTVYTLPVVIHVIHTGTPVGAPDNPSDSLIQAMLALMNAAFRKDGPLYGGADAGFTFALAQRSPECEPATGIIRMNGSTVEKYSTGGITTDTLIFPNSAHELDVKALSRWPNTDYINIWIVNTIDNNPGWPGGYAYHPEYNSALTDGIVLRCSVVNGENKTVIHELGHYFNLLHTFGYAWADCEEETDCSAEGDLICDTELCMFEFSCDEPLNSCTGESWLIADPVMGYTVLNNYMGYTDCQWMFTAQQKERMTEALLSYRPGLLTSRALISPGGSSPVPACSPVAVHGLSPYYGIERMETGLLSIYSNTSLADGGFYHDRTCNQFIEWQAGDSIGIRITGSHENFHRFGVYLDLNNDGEFTSPQEHLLSGEGGILEDSFFIPAGTALLCTPLRLRIVADHPAAPPPAACLITGTADEGAGQIEDYTVVILPRRIVSLHSGNWNDPATWTCNCIPGPDDVIIIDTGDTVFVPQTASPAECAGLRLLPGGWLDAEGDIMVTGGCID